MSAPLSASHARMKKARVITCNVTVRCPYCNAIYDDGDTPYLEPVHLQGRDTFQCGECFRTFALPMRVAPMRLTPGPTPRFFPAPVTVDDQ